MVRTLPHVQPVYERAAERHPDIVFGKVDTEAQPELAGAFRISSIPTLMAVRDRACSTHSPAHCRHRPWRN